jgi:hypothetical protein
MTDAVKPCDVPRPYALDAATQRRIVRSLAAGQFLKTACREAGTTYDTFRRWRDRVEAGDPGAERFAPFFAEVDKTLARCEEDAVSVVIAGKDGWRGAAWYLERRFPGRWRKSRTVEHEDSKDPNIGNG